MWLQKINGKEVFGLNETPQTPEEAPSEEKKNNIEAFGSTAIKSKAGNLYCLSIIGQIDRGSNERIIRGNSQRHTNAVTAAQH